MAIAEARKLYPWEEPNAPAHVVVRQTVHQFPHARGVRADVPSRRHAEIAPDLDVGVSIMTHDGGSNGRLSLLLSTIPENYPVHVSCDAVTSMELETVRDICAHHGAVCHHATPWAGRAGNAINTMRIAPWDVVLFLNDDIWLAPGAVALALTWYDRLMSRGLPLAALAIPGWESYHHWKDWGFASWQDCYEQPHRLEAVPANPAFDRCPALFKNPFGAAMLLNRRAYEDLGGFTDKYWAEDDVYNHQVWTSGRWVNAAYPGKGYIHFGAQSWHHGESVEYVGEFKDATGMSADESGALQVAGINGWRSRFKDLFESLGGTDAV